MTALRIPRDRHQFSLDAAHPAVARVASGTTVVFETYDCYTNQITQDDQPFHTIDRSRNNPATGPLAVAGALPGDTLKVEILDIRIAETGVMALRPGAGVMGEVLPGARSRIFPIRENLIRFNERLSLPVSPMVGVIGVAPEGPGIRSTVPDAHGGNLDCKRIAAGATLYLPVLVPGALLYVGDLHAAMGDGEIAICGLEVAGEVTLRVTVVRGRRFPLPLVRDAERIMTLHSAPTLDEAARQATIRMHTFLTEELGLDTFEATMLLSLQGNLRICQVVDPLMTARMELPSSLLAVHGYEMP
jgi:amidase